MKKHYSCTGNTAKDFFFPLKFAMHFNTFHIGLSYSDIHSEMKREEKQREKERAELGGKREKKNGFK